MLRSAVISRSDKLGSANVDGRFRVNFPLGTAVPSPGGATRAVTRRFGDMLGRAALRPAPLEMVEPAGKDCAPSVELRCAAVAVPGLSIAVFDRGTMLLPID